MKPFWTITDRDAMHTNSSTKFDSEEKALAAATARLQHPQNLCRSPVAILKAVKLVSINIPPIEVEDIVEEPHPTQPGANIV